MIKYLFAALFCTGLIACKTNKIASGTDVIRFDGENWTNGSNGPDVDKPNSVTTDTVVQLVLDTAEIDTLIPEKILKKDVYEVALILPFMEDSMRRAWTNSKGKNFQEMTISEESETSTSFLEGMILALTDMKLEAKFNIHIYDDNNSEGRMETVFNKMKDEKFDIVIGPMDKQNVMKVSEYAMEKNIVHLSPFSPSKTASKGNEKYYQFEPSLEQHILAMIDFSLDSLTNPHFKFFHHSNPSGEAYADMLSMYFDKLNEDRAMEEKINYSNIELSAKAVNTDFKLSKYVDVGATNVVIVNSFDENFIHIFLRQVNQVSKNNDIIIFGMPGWEDSKIVRLEYVSSAELHFTKSFWYDENDLKVSAFETNYKKKYGTMPGQYAFMGYDFAKMMFGTIDTYGLRFNENFLGEEYKGLGRNYLFKKVMTTEDDVLRIENTKLKVYKIVDFEPTLVK